MKIVTLGPAGTFSQQAALRYNDKAEIIFEKTIKDAALKVNDNLAEVGILPIENSVAGTVGETLDSLMSLDLFITSEIIVPIKHNLAKKKDQAITEVKKIYAHPQAYAQCEEYLLKKYKDAEIIETSSNAKSAEIISENGADAIAIVPEIASEIYNLDIIAKNVQDNRFNVTRFIVVSENNGTKPTGHDRTSIAIYPQLDKPGLLYDIIGEFARRKINLTKIESRPAKGKLGDYFFFLDFEGHISDDRVGEAIESVEKSAFVKLFGSYERQY